METQVMTSQQKQDRRHQYRYNPQPGQNPTLVKLCKIIKESELDSRQISALTAITFSSACAVSERTIDRWREGIVKQPLDITMERVAFVLGYERSDWRRINYHDTVKSSKKN
jgi:hypothetical protein